MMFRLLRRATLFLVTVLLAWISIVLPASAGWEFSGKKSDFDSYIDKDTARKSGASVFVSELYNYRQAGKAQNGGVYQSAKFQTEIDCMSSRSRVIEVKFYTGKMASGNVVSTATINEWGNIHPKSPNARTYKSLC